MHSGARLCLVAKGWVCCFTFFLCLAAFAAAFLRRIWLRVQLRDSLLRQHQRKNIAQTRKATQERRATPKTFAPSAERRRYKGVPENSSREQVGISNPTPALLGPLRAGSPSGTPPCAPDGPGARPVCLCRGRAPAFRPGARAAICRLSLPTPCPGPRGVSAKPAS